jgi:hypothetical protein
MSGGSDCGSDLIGAVPGRPGGCEARDDVGGKGEHHENDRDVGADDCLHGRLLHDRGANACPRDPIKLKLAMSFDKRMLLVLAIGLSDLK